VEADQEVAVLMEVKREAVPDTKVKKAAVPVAEWVAAKWAEAVPGMAAG